MNNNLIRMQEMILRQMDRLDNLDGSLTNKQEEISRANALSQNAVTFLKSVNVGLRIKEISNKYEINQTSLAKELGVTNEE